jgi:hypothetical protein
MQNYRLVYSLYGVTPEDIAIVKQRSTKTGISKATFLSLSVIAACPQSFWVFQKDSRQAGMTSM